MTIKMRPWHCYYHLMLGFLLLHYIVTINATILSKEFYPDLFIFIAIETLLIVGLYGFVKKKPIYKQWLWRIAAVIGLLILGYLLYDTPMPYWIGGDVINLLPLAIIFLVLSPWLYGLLSYGFSSQDIWVKRN